MEKDAWLRIHQEIRFWGLLAWGLALPGLCLLGIAITESFTRTIPADPGREARALFFTLSGLGFYGGGLAAYARRKGLPAAWGLMGLSCLLGWLVIRFLPKRCRGCERACGGGTFDCPGCGAPL